MDQPTRVALALGSGGARGYAHIGAIEVIEERGFEIVGVAGSSMGALVGGMYAAGAIDDYTEWARGLNRRDVLRMMEISKRSGGALRAERLLDTMHEMLGGVLIEDLAVPFTAVATDLLARRSVWFQQGPLDLAIRASIAIPGAFTPMVVDGRVVVDGGITDPVPVTPLMAVPADITVAVSLGGDRGAGAPAPGAVASGASSLDGTVELIRRGAEHLLDNETMHSLLGRMGLAGTVDAEPADPDGGGTDDEEPGTEQDSGLSGLDVVTLAYEAMESVLTQYRLAGCPPDVLVTVPKDACRTLEFYRAAELIAVGRQVTADALDRAGLYEAGAGSALPE